MALRRLETAILYAYRNKRVPRGRLLLTPVISSESDCVSGAIAAIRRASPGIVFTKSIQYLAHLMRERQTMGVLHHREVIAGHLDDLQAATE